MNIKEKIKRTGLFTSLEKIELLVSIDQFSPEAITELTIVIDEYDESVKEMKDQFKTEITTQVDNIISTQEDEEAKKALESIKSGYNKILN